MPENEKDFSEKKGWARGDDAEKELEKKEKGSAKKFIQQLDERGRARRSPYVQKAVERSGREATPAQKSFRAELEKADGMIDEVHFVDDSGRILTDLSKGIPKNSFLKCANATGNPASGVGLCYTVRDADRAITQLQAVYPDLEVDMLGTRERPFKVRIVLTLPGKARDRYKAEEVAAHNAEQREKMGLPAVGISGDSAGGSKIIAIGSKEVEGKTDAELAVFLREQLKSHISIEQEMFKDLVIRKGGLFSQTFALDGRSRVVEDSIRNLVEMNVATDDTKGEDMAGLLECVVATGKPSNKGKNFDFTVEDLYIGAQWLSEKFPGMLFDFPQDPTGKTFKYIVTYLEKK